MQAKKPREETDPPGNIWCHRGELATEMISGDEQKSNECRRGESGDGDEPESSNADDRSDESSSNGQQSGSGGTENMGSESRKRMSGMKWLGNVRRIVERAENDWHQLVDDGKLVQAQRRVKRVTKE